MTWRRRAFALLMVVWAAAAAAQAPTLSPADPLARLAWLAGCWIADGAEPGSGEQWMPLAGGTLLGMGRTVRDGKTLEHEFMQIRALPDGRLVYIAQPGGQAATRFVSTTVGDTEVVFENPQHDFPQRVIYRLGEGGRMKARIEGLRNGALRGIDFPLQRASCDAGLPAARAASTPPPR